MKLDALALKFPAPEYLNNKWQERLGLISFLFVIAIGVFTMLGLFFGFIKP
jgi:hypothetical protein